MMMRSILKLRPALERIREDYSKNTDPKLREAIPSAKEFDQVEAIIQALAKVEEMSKFLSSDQNVTICYVVAKLFNIEAFLSSQQSKTSSSPATKSFCKVMNEKLAKRFPKCGTLNKIYAFGALLHPFYRGNILAEFSSQTFRDQIEQFIEDNEKGQAEDLNRVRIEEEEDDEEEYTIEAKIRSQMRTSQVNQANQSIFESAISPLQLEVNRYLTMSDVPPSTVNVLAWWKAHDKEFPLLARAARKYLCIQASSASCERVFSTGGATVTYKRTKLDVENVHMLVYCKDNLPKVKTSSRIYQDEEEEAAEEEISKEDETTHILVESPVRLIGQGKKSGIQDNTRPANQTRSQTPIEIYSD